MERKVKTNKYYVVEYKDNETGMVGKTIAKRHREFDDFSGIGPSYVYIYYDIKFGKPIVSAISKEPLSESGLLTDEELKSKKIYVSRLNSIEETLLTSSYNGEYNREKTLSYKDNF